MNISIQSKGGTPIYEQIATQIKEAILAGKLNKDDALPSIRALSADIKVSVITTKKA
ncbi:MAG: GntR family transcriptional regulator, partial [Agathobacter rectalis]